MSLILNTVYIHIFYLRDLRLYFNHYLISYHNIYFRVIFYYVCKIYKKNEVAMAYICHHKY